MRRCLGLLSAICAVYGLFASPAGAAPPPGQITAYCVVGAGEPCTNEFGPAVGRGEDLDVAIGNKCVGPSVCFQHLFFPLGGNFGNVVVDVANQCTDGATCRISVDGFGASFKSFQIKRGMVFGTSNLAGINIKNHCDAMSVCSIDPWRPGPYTPTTGGLCVSNQPGVDPCLIGGTVEGTGGDLHVLLGNQCSVATSCTQDWTLTGSFNTVVIERANECSNHATCTITVHIEAHIKSLKMRNARFRWDAQTFVANHCDATAVCTVTR